MPNKAICALLILLATVFACKKQSSPEELEGRKLTEMQKNIINDWKIIKIMTVKPSSQYGVIWTISCQDALTYSFKSDKVFNHTYDPPCFPSGSAYGFWDLPTTDSLFLEYRGPINPGTYEKKVITKLTADTLKWTILSQFNNEVITQEYTLIPK
jgi:hypothetical protein